MPRFLIVIIILWAFCFLPTQGAVQAQSPEARYVQIPFQGDFEALLKLRLQAVQNAPLQQLLKQIGQDPKKYNLNPDLLKQLDLDNPALQEQLKGMLEKVNKGGQISPEDTKSFVKIALKQLSPLGGKGQKKSDPMGATLPPRIISNQEAPANPPQARSDLLNRWLRDWMDQAEGTAFLERFRDSPAFQKGLRDLKTLGKPR